MTQAAKDVRPPQRRRMSGDDRASQLLDVAEDLFMRQGYDGTSIEDIARAAGVTRPVVYQHHGNKEQIYLACVRRAREAYDGALYAAVSSSDDPREQVARGTALFFQALAGDPGRWELLFGRTGVSGGTVAEELARERFRTVELIADQFQAHAPHLDRASLEIFASAVSGAAEQVGRWWLRHPEVPLDDVVEQHVALVWPGLKALIRSVPRAAASSRGGATSSSRSRRRPG